MNKNFRRLLVANRSEIATRVFRSAHELGIHTIAIYSHEDRHALHRFKADQAFLIGKKGEPIRAYLDIEAIVDLAEREKIDAIHPGYGFLSENAKFAAACEARGIAFIGPNSENLIKLGDKTAARRVAVSANVPVLAGSENPLQDAKEAQKLAEKMGYPVILKAAHGGGGRGMRVINKPEELAPNLEQAQREAFSAFGSGDIFVEKFIARARHIEVQLLGDQHGNLVHLYERDCSVQRRHQKVVEIAPAPSLATDIRDGICQAALDIGNAVGYSHAGTVEFLVDADTGKFYFIEVNPRIQVEHTVTEEVTGIDIVKSQILIAQGSLLSDPEIGCGKQEEVQVHGFAVQCRVTTEDPSNNFLPDYGRVTHYRSASGPGIRLDAGSAFSGAVVNPFYDSLLVKVSSRGLRFHDAVRKMDRCLHEFRIRGVKTNIPFLISLVNHPTFLDGQCTTRFIDETPELFKFVRRRDRATRLLSFLAETIVNGNPLVKDLPISPRREPAPLPKVEAHGEPPAGMRQKLHQLGAADFGKWLREHKPLLLTDTTFRDAHQSLLATRLRTYDLLQIAEAYAYLCPQLFSLEMWGGATFDTSMRFLKESPWQRLTELRERIPNILFQMLLRASNAVGYTNYPDNVVEVFVKEAATAGIDVFRIFDALNWVPNMRVAMEAVLNTDAICEAAICYSGDILDPQRTKYDLKYYVNLAKELEKMGAHLLAIKDMAGLCKPQAATLLIRTLKQEIGLPIHFHTHDTAGIQAGAIMNGAEQDLDIADAAMSPLSGGTSQPNLNTLVEALRFTDRAPELRTQHLDAIADYWRAVREFYTPFESQVLPASADLYQHEMPGGQYTNLYQQARALGLADRWSEVCHVYAQVNQLFGDIVKVTPTSKAVGDMALFMVANDLTPQDVLAGEKELAYPSSVIDLLSGKMGQPPGGFPQEVVKKVVQDHPLVSGRPGESLPPEDFDADAEKLEKLLQRPPQRREVVTYLLYPKVYTDFVDHFQKFSDVSHLTTPVFFFGPEPQEEFSVDIEPGKTLFIKYLTVSEPHADGRRNVFFELNGQPRVVSVTDHSLGTETQQALKADPKDPKQVASTMPGMVVSVPVQVGDKVTAGQKLLSLEAMKMETQVNATVDGKVAEILVERGTQVETGDLLVRIE